MDSIVNLLDNKDDIKFKESTIFRYSSTNLEPSLETEIGFSDLYHPTTSSWYCWIQRRPQRYRRWREWQELWWNISIAFCELTAQMWLPSSYVPNCGGSLIAIIDKKQVSTHPASVSFSTVAAVVSMTLIVSSCCSTRMLICRQSQTEMYDAQTNLTSLNSCASSVSVRSIFWMSACRSWTSR